MDTRDSYTERNTVHSQPSIRSTFTVILSLGMFVVLAWPWTAQAQIPWQFHEHRSRGAMPAPVAVSPPLVLDDGTSEGEFGFGGASARQFLWFNQFSLPAAHVDLQEIQVLFPSGPNMAIGNSVDLVVYHDVDGDPSNGATWLATYPETIQVVDGVTFSAYPVNPPLPLPQGGDVLIGVIPRFIASGVTSQTSPAALDTTASQGRSWVAVWTDDPPAPPELPPDLLIDPVEVFVSGNWMIRATLRGTPVVAVPTASGWGLLGLVLGMLTAGLTLLWRR